MADGMESHAGCNVHMDGAQKTGMVDVLWAKSWWQSHRRKRTRMLIWKQGAVPEAVTAGIYP